MRIDCRNVLFSEKQGFKLRLWHIDDTRRTFIELDVSHV